MIHHPATIENQNSRDNYVGINQRPDLAGQKQDTLEVCAGSIHAEEM